LVREASGSGESANKLVVEARLKGAGMRWGRQNVDPMLVLRTQRRQAQSQQRLDSALWFLVVWGVRVYRLSHPPVAASPTPTAVASSAKHPTHRPGAGYSWRKPFLRRPSSTRAATEEVCAKK